MRVRVTGADQAVKGDWAVWYLLACLVFIAPIPLGSNRPWAWWFVAAMGFSIATISLVFRTDGRLLANKRSRILVFLLLGWASYPFLQIIPLQMSLLSWISHSSYAIWSSVNVTEFATISVNPSGTLRNGLVQASAICVSIVAMSLFQYRAFRYQFAWLLVIIGTINTAVSVINTGLGSGFLLFRTATGGVENLFTGTYINKNHYAGLMEMIIPFAVGLIIRQRAKQLQRGSDGVDIIIWLLVLCGLAMLIGLVMSGSRAGVFSLVVSLAITVIAFRRSLSLGFRAILALFTAIALFAMFVLLAEAPLLSAAYLGRGLGDARLMILKDSLVLIDRFWLFGGGLGGFEFVFPAVKSPELNFSLYDHAHNDYLEYVVNIGVVGGLPILAYFVMIVRRVYAKYRYTRSSNADYLAIAGVWSMLSMAVHSLFDFNLQIPANFLVFVLIAAFVAQRGLYGSMSQQPVYREGRLV